METTVTVETPETPEAPAAAAPVIMATPAQTEPTTGSLELAQEVGRLSAQMETLTAQLAEVRQVAESAKFLAEIQPVIEAEPEAEPITEVSVQTEPVSESGAVPVVPSKQRGFLAEILL